MRERKLGLHELQMAAAHDIGNNTTSVINDFVIKGEIEPGRARQVFEHLFHKHPLLHSVIEVKEGEYSLHPTAKFEDISIEWLDLHDNVIEDELSHPFEIEKALWRVIAFNRGETTRIVFSVHHAIADGSSPLIFIDQFITLYEKLEKGDQLERESLPFLPSIDAMLPKKVSIEAYEGLCNHLSHFEFDHYPYEESVPIDARRTRAQYFDLSVAPLVKVAKQEALSLNSLLNGAMLKAYAQLWGKEVAVPNYTPISLREVTEPPLGYEHFGDYISVIQVNCEVKLNETLFDVGRNYKASLDEEIGNQSMKPVVANLSSAQVLEKFGDFQSGELGVYPMGLSFTNLTRYPFNPKYKAHSIESIHFTVSRNAGDLPFVIHAITVADMLYLSVAWTHPCMSDESAMRFCQLFIEQLRAATNGTEELRWKGGS